MDADLKKKMDAKLDNNKLAQAQAWYVRCALMRSMAAALRCTALHCAVSDVACGCAAVRPVVLGLAVGWRRCRA